MLASNLTSGVLVDMEPVYVDFEETGHPDYLMSQTELSRVIEIEATPDGGVVIVFDNIGLWKLPMDYELIVEVEK